MAVGRCQWKDWENMSSRLCCSAWQAEYCADQPHNHCQDLWSGCVVVRMAGRCEGHNSLGGVIVHIRQSSHEKWETFLVVQASQHIWDMLQTSPSSFYMHYSKAKLLMTWVIFFCKLLLQDFKVPVNNPAADVCKENMKRRSPRARFKKQSTWRVLKGRRWGKMKE